jgi:hypothetical protein
MAWRPEGKRPLGRPTRRWDGNIKMDHQEIGGGGTSTALVWLWIGTGKCGDKISGFIKYGKFLDYLRT